MKFALGAKRNPIRDLPEYHVSAIPLPAKVLTDISMLPRLNQGQQPSCVGHAMANAIAYDYWKKTGHVPLISPRFIYARAKLLDGDPTGEGTSAYYAYQGISQFGGAATTATVPNDVTLPCDEYMVVSITDPITQEAKLYPVKTEVEIQNPTDAQLRSLISQYGVICIACDVDENTWMNQNGNVSLLPGTAGGHETILFGYDTTVAPSTQYDDLNSWGAAWGQNGTGKFLWSDYQGQVYDAMAVTIDIANAVSYSTSFISASNNTLGWEGGLTNDPNDPGGVTNFGISQRSYPNLNIAALTQAQAVQIYYSDFWSPIFGDLMPKALAMNVFDMALNCGTSAAIKTMQSALGVTVDGIIGNITKGAMAAATTATVTTFATLRAEYYAGLSQFQTYKNTWLSRTVGTLVKSLTN